MKLLNMCAIAALPLLAACANLEGQTGMSAVEQCALAQTAVMLAEVNEVAPDVLARAKLNVAVFCDAPLARPADLADG